MNKDYIDKLFKQYPFIYLIDDEYYAFGSGVCCKVPDGFSSLPYRYKEYIRCGSNNCERLQAWKAFHSLMNIASTIKDEKGFEFRPEDTFRTFSFNELSLCELVKQIESYKQYFQKYALMDYLQL